MVFNSLNNKFEIYNEIDEDLTNEIKYMKKTLKHALKCEKIKNAEFNVIIVSKEKILDINTTYRDIPKVTDVISFALEEKDNIDLGSRLLGDIYICYDRAKEQAKEYNHSIIREMCFLSVHGLLHLLGYDHMTKLDEKIMFKKQELILNGQRFTRIKEK